MVADLTGAIESSRDPKFKEQTLAGPRGTTLELSLSFSGG